MSVCVLDSSVALAWVLPGESDARTIELLSQVATAGAAVSGIWRLEIANVLLMAERRQRITLRERSEAIASLADLPIHVDPHTGARAWGDTIALAETRNLTVYDATYLELAIRLRLPLATRDHALRRAAGDCGVSLA